MTLALRDVMSIRRRNRKVCEIPFNSTNKYQVLMAILTYILHCNLLYTDVLKHDHIFC